jgi:uncharacterized membrane protein YbhN (UPF0104 family)
MTISPPRAPTRRPLARQAIGRSPWDVAKLTVSVAVSVAAFIAVGFHHVNLLESAIYRDLNGGPRWLDSVSRVVVLAGSPGGIAVFAGVALVSKRLRLAAGLVVTGVLGWLSGHLTRVFEAPRVTQVTVRGHGEVLRTIFPADHMAVFTAMATFASAYLPRRARRLVPLALAVEAVALDMTGHQLALDVVAGAFIGWAMSLVVTLAAGAPGRSVAPQVVEKVLADAGLTPAALIALSTPLRGPIHFEARTEQGQCLMVELVRRGQRRAGWTYKVRRLLASLEVEDEPGLSTPRHEVDHEALVSLLAERAGVRTPRVVFAGELGHGPALLVRQKVDGRRLNTMAPDECPDALLDDIWRQVELLGRGRIAHHDLRADNLLVDSDGRPWLLDFTFAKAGADSARVAQDVAEVLVSLASVAGPDRAVSSAVRVVSSDVLARALTYLQPLALPLRIRAQLSNRGLLVDVAELLAARLGARRPSFRPKIRARTLAALVVGGGAVYLLLPQIGTVPRLVNAVEHANYWWMVVAAACGAATFGSDAVSYMGASRLPMPFWRTTAVQLASAFTSRLTPLGMGGIALNVVYMERQGGDRSEALASVALNQGAGVVVHAALFFIAAGFLGFGGLVGKAKLPTRWPILVAVVAVLAAAGLFLNTGFGRRRVVAPAFRVLRHLSGVVRHPLRATGLFLGSAGVTVFNGLALVASVAAFHGQLPVWSVMAVYIGGAAIASAAPTPGNLGAVEAALAAGLTGIGILPEQAVGAVLAFRLLTFWLPIIPGLLTLRYLEHRGVI